MQVYDIAMYELTYEEALQTVQAGKQVLVYCTFYKSFLKIVTTESALEEVGRGMLSVIGSIHYLRYFT